MEKITFCGDDCLACPRYNAKTDAELSDAAELWYRAGWRDSIASNDEMRCNGCTSDKNCTYKLVDCTRQHNVEKCRLCAEFPCDKIREMLERSEKYCQKCREVCSAEEFETLSKAFFNKEENLKK